jgi:predicted alpha-1,2-mannosidase
VWAGLAFPGSSLPNAMVQLSPITEFNTGSGYQYEDSVIQAFAHTNKGHWNLCHLPVLPVVGAANASGGYSSHYSHATETAAPGYYGVTLKDYNVRVRLTSTLRCGLHQYTYAQPQDRSLVFKLGRSNENVNDWNIEKVGSTAVQGFQKTGDQTAYFYAQLSDAIQDIAIQGKGTKQGLAVVRLANGSRKPVELRIGLSFVSTQNAQQNLAQELGSRSFEDVQRAATATWNQLLTKVSVKGGTAQQQTMFYTCLYRSFLWPALRSDTNGEYSDVKGKVCKADFQYYTTPSLWDTYRNKDVLMSMLAPGVTADIIKSMQDIGHKTGFIPTSSTATTRRRLWRAPTSAASPTSTCRTCTACCCATPTWKAARAPTSRSTSRKATSPPTKWPPPTWKPPAAPACRKPWNMPSTTTPWPS